MTALHKLSPASSGKSPNKLQSLFNPFAKTQDKMDQLTECLNNYSLHGLPSLPDWVKRSRPQYDSNALFLEEHWSNIVESHDKMNKRQRDQQEALWELLTTEVEYIRKIKVIIDLFYCCLVHLQANQVLNEINTEMIFSNVSDVFYATLHFWVAHMSQVLNRSRETREPLDASLLKSGFQVFDKLFEPYVKYCLDLEYCRDYLKCKMRDNDLFKTFITWAEAQTQCSRLSLVDLIAKPFQRITKYALLLFAIKKPLEKMESNGNVDQQKKDIGKMVQQVERFVIQVNKAMRQRHEHIQLSIMMDKIDSYEAVDVPSDDCLKLTEKFCKLDLSKPMPGCEVNERRNLLFEGGLKFKDSYTKTDVYCFLFTDMFLITKSSGKRGDKVKVIKPPMRLDKIVVQSMRDFASFMVLYLNEYRLAQAVYTLHGDSKLWVSHITKAQKDFQERTLNHESLKTRGLGWVGSFTTQAKDIGRFAYDSDIDSSSSIQYRSQLSVPSLCSSEVQSEVFERKISSERIKRKVLSSSPGIKKDFLCETADSTNSRLSASTHDLNNSEDVPASNMLSKRSSVSHHRRHSSDPIRDLESLASALLSSSFPGANEGEIPTSSQLDWNLGDTHTDAETPSSGKNSDGSNLYLESSGSKTSLNSNQMNYSGNVTADKSSSEPDFALKFQTRLENPHSNKPIPIFEFRKASICNVISEYKTTTSNVINKKTTSHVLDDDSDSNVQSLQRHAFKVNNTKDFTNLEGFGVAHIPVSKMFPEAITETPKSIEGSSEETDSEPLQSCEESSFDMSDKTQDSKASASEASESNRSQEEEFHMCYLPEEYPSLPQSSITNHHKEVKLPWKYVSFRHRSVVFYDASTQTPIEFLITGYFGVISNPCKPQPSHRPVSKSLPNIFEFKPELSVPLLCSKDITENRKISDSLKNILTNPTRSKIH